MATTAAPATGVPPQQNAAPPPAVVPDPIAPAPVAPPPPVVVAPPPAPVVQLAEEDRAAGAIATEQHVAVPPEAFRKIKDSATARGRREQEAAFNARAIALGFPTAEAMFAALETQETPMATTAPPTAPISQPAATPAAAPAPIAPVAPSSPPPPAAAHPAITAPPPAAEDPNAPENDRRVPDHVRKKLRQARDEMRSKTALAEQQAQAAQTTAQQYQAQIETMRVEQSMREDLIRGGMRDLDFGFFELKKHLAALTADKTPEGAEKLKAFDLKVWAEEQRKIRPFLFGEQPVPANTGTTTPPPGAPPTPGAVTGAAGDASRVDSRSLSADDFTKRMKALGINTGGSAPPPRR